MAPMTRARSSEAGVPGGIVAEYYTQRSGAGLLITEGTCISAQGHGWHCAPGIYTDEHEEAWKKVTTRVKQSGRGAAMYLQLWHLGRQSHSSVTGQAIVSSSAVPLKHHINGKNGVKLDAETPHPLTEDEIVHVVNDYARAAERSIAAGFDGVEIHGANGYLIDQFTQTATNTRGDRYGGSLENRLRFALEVTDAVVSRVGADRVGFRLSPNGAFGEMGSADNVETFTALIEQLCYRKLAYIHLMDGLGFGFHEKCEVFTAAMAREILSRLKSDTKLIVNVGYTRETGNEVIASGNADAVAFGRPFISNPDLAERFVANAELNPDAEKQAWWTSSLGAEGLTTFPFMA